jgi:putative DNA methylase
MHSLGRANHSSPHYERRREIATPGPMDQLSFTRFAFGVPDAVDAPAMYGAFRIRSFRSQADPPVRNMATSVAGACGAVTRHRLDAATPRCSDCGVTYSERGTVYCPHCRTDGVTEAARRIAPHEVVLVQRWREVADGPMVYLDHPTDDEAGRTRRSSPLAPSLASRIPRGHETNKLRRAGFTTWASLYPSRQLEVLIRAAELLEQMDVDPVIRDRLRLCLAGATEMPGHLCRWDRYHPKVFEALSNHRYSFDGLAIEPNPLAPAGRGSLTRRLRGSVLAARELAEIASAERTVTYLRTDINRSADMNRTVTITQGSSERLLLPDRCGSIIVTDPPYYDSVQYGELASLFLAWAGPMGIASKSGSFRSRSEAVPNRFRRTGPIAYRQRLVDIFAECARVIQPRGRLVLTYHSTDLRAWWALGSALAANGFCIAAIAAARTENGADHAKRGKRSFVSDLLIECSLEARVRPRRDTPCPAPRSTASCSPLGRRWPRCATLSTANSVARSLAGQRG